MRFRYDKRDKKIFLICGIAFTVLFVIALIVAGVEDVASEMDTLGIIAAILLIFLPIPAFAGWYAYLDCMIYIKKLERGGVEVPEDKRLKPMLDAPPVYPGMEKNSKESIALAVICFVLAGGMLLHILFFFFKWDPRIGDECAFMAFLQLIPAVLWGAGGGFFIYQSSPEHYRDDTVFDPGRKERISLLKGILLLIILLGITAAAYAVAHSMTDYVYRSRLRDRYGENYREHIGEPAKAGTVY